VLWYLFEAPWWSMSNQLFGDVTEGEKGNKAAGRSKLLPGQYKCNIQHVGRVCQPPSRSIMHLEIIKVFPLMF